MQQLTTNNSTRQINNLVARIKSRYPHLYEETGGKYIRKILRTTLETAEETKAETASVTNQTRIIKRSHQASKAA